MQQMHTATWRRPGVNWRDRHVQPILKQSGKSTEKVSLNRHQTYILFCENVHTKFLVYSRKQQTRTGLGDSIHFQRGLHCWPEIYVICLIFCTHQSLHKNCSRVCENWIAMKILLSKYNMPYRRGSVGRPSLFGLLSIN